MAGILQAIADAWLDAANALRSHLVDAVGTALGTAGNPLRVQGPAGAGADQVQGTAADGAPAVGNPVQVGGKDGAGNAQALTTDTDGHPQVDALTFPRLDAVNDEVRASGNAATGAAVAGSPVYVGGIDLGGLARPLRTETDGAQDVVERSNTGAAASVAQNAANVALLAAAANRRGAIVYNDSPADLYVALGFASSLIAFTARLTPNSYYEVPFGFRGTINGIWAAAGAGNARITELTVV